ncbi:MAG: TlpA disulfide reductase family protein [Bacteroidota bacterium]
MIRNTILLTIIAFFLACQPQNQKDTSKITIAGKLINANGEEVSLFKGRQKIPITVKDSIFSIKLPANYAGVKHSIGIENNFIVMFFMPGDSVFVEFDCKTKDYVFSGDQVLANNFLKEKAEKDKTGYFMPQKSYNLEIDDFNEKMDSVLKSNHNFFDKYMEKHPDINEDFVYFEKAETNYGIYFYKTYYASTYQYRRKDTIPQDSKLFEFKKSINLNDAKIINSKYYQNFLEYTISQEAGKLYNNDSTIQKKLNPVILSRLEFIKSSISDSTILNHLLFSLMKSQFRYYATNGIDDVLPFFKENCTNQDYKSEIDSIITDWAKISKGSDAYPFVCQDITGKTYGLEDFKGKYIYIDFWATWCAPCLSEVPYLEKIIDDYKGKNIVFISISVDENKAAWEKMMRKKNAKGYQLHISKEESEKMMKYYKISGIPRFILLDPESKIYNVQAARPSGNIRQVLDNLENI